MRRIKLVLAALAAVATLVMVSASPAMAQPVGCFFDANGNLVCPNNGFFPDQFVTSPFGTFGPNQEFSERRITSGAANPTTTIRNTGDNVNLCTPVQQVVNTGNVANEQGFVPVGNGFIDNGFVDNGFIDNGFLFPNDNFGFGGDVDFEGSNITIEPSATATCDQTINQAAAA